MRSLLTLALLLVSATFVRAADTEFQISLNGPNAQVQLPGNEGDEFMLESASSLGDWSVVSSFLLNSQNRTWQFPNANTGSRFFRGRTLLDEDAQFAGNFRLIDHTGKSRELHYYQTLTSLRAIVLVFAEGNYSAFAPKIANLRSRSIFQNSVLFWTIETGPAASRAALAQQATQASITWPLLHDPLQLTAQDFGARFRGEAFVIRRNDMRVVYRGLIDDAIGGATPVNAYLATALSNVISAASIEITRMEPTQPVLNRVTREIADYSAIIAPIIQNKCVICHSPDNIAPFALTNYQSVVEHSDEILEEVMSRHMPPWHADPEYSKFKNDFSLSPTELAQLVDWLEAGLPRGEGSDPLTNVPPPPPKWPIELGPPDQIVKIPIQQVAATGTLPYRYIHANSTNTTDRWLKAAIVRPSNRRVVHHYIVWEGHTSSAQLSGIAEYVPGRIEGGLPPGTGILLKANMPMTFNLHYTASGEAETDEPELALWYASAPPAAALQMAAALDFGFTIGFSSIPAGASDHQLVAQHTFADAVRLYSVSPHMHFRGSRMRFELAVPGQARTIIASIPNYHFDWQTSYNLDPPLDLPANSTIHVIGAFDNSAQNLHNPNPNIAVGWGEQSWEEMFIGYMEYSIR